MMRLVRPFPKAINPFEANLREFQGRMVCEEDFELLLCIKGAI